MHNVFKPFSRIRGTNRNSNAGVHTSFSTSIAQFIDSNPSDTKWNRKNCDSSDNDKRKIFQRESIYLVSPSTLADSGEGDGERIEEREVWNAKKRFLKGISNRLMFASVGLQPSNLRP